MECIISALALGICSINSRKVFTAVVCLAAGCCINPAAAGDGSKEDFSPAKSSIRFYQKYISDLRFGNCRFEPSCSQYAHEAVGKYGFLKGPVLAADRLIRCNRSAHYFYTRNSEGRLADPVGDHPGGLRRPKVPDWLLPRLHSPPFLNSFPEASPLNPDSTHRKAVSTLVEYTAFADALAAKGDCWRAETEYKRVAFLAKMHEVDRWALMKAGNCYYRQESWEKSASRFLEAAAQSRTEAERNTAYFMVAASHFSAGYYEKSAKILDRCKPGSAGSNSTLESSSRLKTEQGFLQSGQDSKSFVFEKTQFLKGLCSLALGDWTGSAGNFREIEENYPDSPNRKRVRFLRNKAEEGAKLSRKRPKLAAGVSAIIPGSGQMYAGRAYDGFRHFVFDGLLIYSVYWLLKEENYAGGYLLTGFTLPFYFGNIIGAKRSAESYNSSKRMAYVSKVIAEAGAE